MARLHKAVVLGVITGVLGLGASLLPLGLDLEENVGLDLLFHLRGVRQAPAEVMIVSMDKASAERLELPYDFRKWPRSLHARLIDRLAKEGAAVIVFDLLFDEPRSANEDHSLMEAMSKARNVVLCSQLRSERVSLTGKGGPIKGDANIVKQVPPIAPLARAAVGLAPLPLPKVPVRLNQYWTFKTEAGETPTLPVVAFQVFAGEGYGEFVRLLEKVSPEQSRGLPREWSGAISGQGIETWIQTIRDVFDDDFQIAERLLVELRHRNVSSLDEKRLRMVRSLIKMYQSRDIQYLNFYGPPRTITTLPYYEVLLNDEEKSDGRKAPDFDGKAVFVGHSALFASEQKEGFYSVFSSHTGLDIGGVEIAATAFANLLEDRPIQPLRVPAHIAMLFLWGMGVGILCLLFPAGITAVLLIGLDVFYLFAAVYQFKGWGTWCPVVLPLFFQAPLAFLGGVLWKYIDTNKERQNIKKALGYYLPGPVVDQLAKDIVDLKKGDQLVYGVCLWTDVEQYTSFSEKMGPRELGSFMNEYFETVFKPIKQYGGIVANVIGDSFLAIWVAGTPEDAARDKACLAALDILAATKASKQPSGTGVLPTRIGLHSGPIFLGNVGAIDHYEYRPIGDIVNTTTRIEALNKYLGTRILVSEMVVRQLQGFLTREIGEFILVGKSRPLMVHELISRKGEFDDQEKAAYHLFGEGLAAFRKGAWDGAMEKFSGTIDAFGEDRPSAFYLKLCGDYKRNPPERPWDGIIRMDRK